MPGGLFTTAQGRPSSVSCISSLDKDGVLEKDDQVVPTQPTRLHDMLLIHAHDQWVEDSDELPCSYRHSRESLNRPMLWRTPSSRVTDEPGRLLFVFRLRYGPATKPISTASLVAGNRNHQIVHSMPTKIVSRSVGASSITPPIRPGHGTCQCHDESDSCHQWFLRSTAHSCSHVVQFDCEVG